MSKEKIITAIDIGSSKISTIIAAVTESKISVIGVSGNVPSKGIKKGNVVDIDKAVESITESVTRAERMAGTSVTDAVVTINGSHIKSQNSHGVVAVTPSETSEISPDDVKRVIEAAQAVSLPSSRDIVHVLPHDYTVDSQDGIKDPVGMQGVRLEVEANVIHCATIAMKNIIRCVSQVGLNVKYVTFVCISSSQALLTETEKELGVLLVDIGGDTTSMTAFYEGGAIYSAVLPIGGNHITNDIAIGLRARLEEAEKIKFKLSSLTKDTIDEFDITEFGLENDKNQVALIKKIIELRLQEIFDLILLELEKEGLTKKLKAGFVITGGGALTSGLERKAKLVTKAPIRIGYPSGVTGLIDDIKGPDASAAIGSLLYYVQEEKTLNRLSIDEQKGKILTNLLSYFKKLKIFLP